MESAVKREPVPLGWKLAMLAPLAIAVTLAVLASRQSDLRTEIALSILGGMLTQVAMITLSIYWIAVKKWMGWGIAILIVSSAVLGFGVHTLLRVI